MVEAHRGVLTIRPAAAEDVDRGLHLLDALRVESPYYQRRVIDPAKARTVARVSVGQGGALAVEDAGKIVGALVAVLIESFYGPELEAGLLFLYLLPTHRGGTTTMRLIREYERWAVSRGAVEATLAVSSGIHSERTGRFYERLGYGLTTRSYNKCLA